jgi:predicted phosphodiesterase
VHANLAALQAVLDAVRTAGIARGAVTGDLVMRGADPEACVGLVRGTGWPVVVGNTDRRVALERPRPRRHPASARVGSRSWTRRRLSPEALDWLAALPLVAHTCLGAHRVAIVHGAPDDPTVAPGEDTPDEELLALAEALGADAVVTGHTHRPYLRRVGGRLFVNPGSVGEAVLQDRRPAWAWLAAGPDGLRAGLERVPQPLAALRE